MADRKQKKKIYVFQQQRQTCGFKNIFQPDSFWYYCCKYISISMSKICFLSEPTRCKIHWIQFHEFHENVTPSASLTVFQYINGFPESSVFFYLAFGCISATGSQVSWNRMDWPYRLYNGGIQIMVTLHFLKF